MRSIWLVARKEFLDCLQSRWLLSGGLLFAILALAVFYGTAAIGGSFAYPPLSVVMNSLVSLTVFLLPLLAILLSYDAFVGELEGGMLILMLTYPVTRTAFLLGKAVGQGAALFIVLTVGFAVMPIAASFAAVPYSVGELTGALTVTASGARLHVCGVLRESGRAHEGSGACHPDFDLACRRASLRPGAAGCGRILYGRLAARRFERPDAC